MPTRDVLTKADLAELRRSALGTADPLGVAADLAQAAERGRLEDPDDAGDALTLAEVYGPDWDAHRGRLETELVRLRGAGQAGLGVFRATVDGLTAFAGRSDGDPTDATVRAGYAAEVSARPSARIPWPPERNDACWCGSGLKYKKDCLPRSR
ncbi:SEC-C domain-containing protein [Micromonospora sp. NPDC049230]|uniref:SEC-C domain-containing protein n=1 Tax=Micromonospora sp. NPDC049230 TaxID=3155502 RepID=UPI003405B4B5